MFWRTKLKTAAILTTTLTVLAAFSPRLKAADQAALAAEDARLVFEHADRDRLAWATFAADEALNRRLEERDDWQSVDIWAFGLTNRAVEALARRSSLEDITLKEYVIVERNNPAVLDAFAKEGLDPALLEAITVGVTDAGLARLADLPRLRRLHLRVPGMGDDALIALAKAPALEELVVDLGRIVMPLQQRPGITDKGLAALGACPTLRSFTLLFDGPLPLPAFITAEGLGALAQSATLETLSLEAFALGLPPAEVLAALRPLPTLKKLHVHHGMERFLRIDHVLDGAALAAGPERWPGLAAFTVGTFIDDSGLEALAAYSRLERLELVFAQQVTDAGLDALARGAPALRHLRLERAARLTPAALTRFRRLRPEVEVDVQAWITTTAVVDDPGEEVF